MAGRGERGFDSRQDERIDEQNAASRDQGPQCVVVGHDSPAEHVVYGGLVCWNVGAMRHSCPSPDPWTGRSYNRAARDSSHPRPCRYGLRTTGGEPRMSLWPCPWYNP